MLRKLLGILLGRSIAGSAFDGVYGGREFLGKIIGQITDVIHRRLIGLFEEAVERLVHPHSEDKSRMDQAALLILADTLLEFFVMKYDLLLFGEFLDLRVKLG